MHIPERQPVTQASPNGWPALAAKIALCFPAALLFFWGCATPGRPPAPAAIPRAVVHTSRTYALGKVPDQDREQAFQDLLSSAYDSALKRSGATDIGFSYSLAPKGAVYAFSEVEVSCLIKATDAASGGRLCSDFFSAVDAGIKNIRGK